ncbi:MAG: MBL fold metallo-hydrolase [Haloquadratum sp.]
MPTTLSDRAWRFELRGVNAYLVDDNVPTLVDAGTPWDAGTLRTGLNEVGTAVADVERVLLTHYDLDHVGALAALTPDLDATVYAGGFAADVLRGRTSPPLSNHKGLIQRVGRFIATHPDLPIEPVADGDEIGSFTAYHTPGHTPGHVAYVSADLSVGLLGDLVLASDGGLDPSTWAMSYDTDEVRESIVRLAERAPPFEVACVGHGEPLVSGGSEALAALARDLR